MAIARQQTTAWVSKYEGVDTDAEATLTFTGVLANSLLVVTIIAFRYVGSAGANWVDGVTSGGGSVTWSLAKRQQVNGPVTGFTTEITEWYTPNAGAGTHNVVLNLNGIANTSWRWHGEEYTGAASSSPLGPTNGDAGLNGETSNNTGSTGPLPQADMVVRGSVVHPYAYDLTDTGSGWTEQIGFDTTGITDFLGAMTVDKIVSATTAQEATWSNSVDVNDQGWAAIITSYKAAGASVSKRIEITGCDPAINGTTGWTVYFWQTDPSSGLVSGVYKSTGITAEATGGAIYVTANVPASATDGTTFSCVAYRPGATPIRGLVGVLVGTLQDY